MCSAVPCCVCMPVCPSVLTRPLCAVLSLRLAGDLYSAFFPNPFSNARVDIKREGERENALFAAAIYIYCVCFV